MRKLSLLLLSVMVHLGTIRAQTLDLSVNDMVMMQEISMPASDSTVLKANLFLPLLNTDIYAEVPVLNVRANIKIVPKGTQLFSYPEQADPKALPVIFTRTPYNKNSDQTGLAAALLGYAGISQDMRGRYASGGTYLPMYSDGWSKSPYFADSVRHLLDTTAQADANAHEDGVQSLRYIIHQLKDSTGRSISNGNVGMFGASALGNAQYSLAAAAPVHSNLPGLKCLFPIVGSAEFYNSAGFVNGVFRESLIAGWLGFQLLDYPFQNNPEDSSVNNFIHSLQDYGPGITSTAALSEKAIDFWSTAQNVRLPGAAIRASMDVSAAPINQDGTGNAASATSRYKNMNVPMYHYTGWWDIFVDGQIQTWQYLKKELSPEMAGLQKLVIGPFAHQTMGTLTTGDLTYPANAVSFLGADVSDFSPEMFTKIINSELYDWFRAHLGTPKVLLPESSEWQPINTLISVRIPARDYEISYLDFVNFITGAQGLDSIPISINLSPGNIIYQNIPATNVNALTGGPAERINKKSPVNFNSTLPGGIPDVRIYLTGPINDAENTDVGNYWLAADTFPIKQTEAQKFYLSADGTLPTDSATALPGYLEYLHHPDHPVYTIGGHNMLVNTPNGSRRSQGQMNLAAPEFADTTLNRDDVLSFTGTEIEDSLTVIGYPEISFYAKSSPVEASPVNQTSVDFMVRILDVYPDGREMFVTQGTVNSSYRAYARSICEGSEDRNAPIENILADSLYQYKFRLWPIAHVWGKGHRIKVLISSSNYPCYQSNPGVPTHNGELFRRKPGENKSYTFEGHTLQARTTLQTLVMDTTHTASLQLPVYTGGLQRYEVSIDAFNAPANQKTVVYPNPFRENLALQLGVPDRVLIEVFNILGHKVYSQYTDEPYRHTVHGSAFAPGLYIIKINHPQGPDEYVRVVKEK